MEAPLLVAAPFLLHSLDVVCSAESFTLVPQSMQLRKPLAELNSLLGKHKQQLIFISFEKLKPTSNLVPRYQISN